MKPSRKKLLVAALGVAAINYGASCHPVTSGNLMAPDPDPTDAAADADAANDAFITSGNLVAPVSDAGPDSDAAGSDGSSDTGAD